MATIIPTNAVRPAHPQPFLSLAPVRDKHNRRIVLIHSDSLPSARAHTDADAAPTGYASDEDSGFDLSLPLAETAVLDLLLSTGPSDPDPHAAATTAAAASSEHLLTVVYLHAGLASTDTPSSLPSVRAFRSAYDHLAPFALRARIASVIVVHMSFLTRLHVYAASFGLAAEEYGKLEYADLLPDMEAMLGVDATLLGLRPCDWAYDAVMMHWVGRAPCHVQAPTTRTESRALPEHLRVDPSKPLINLKNVSFEFDAVQDGAPPLRPRVVEEP